MRVEMNMGYMNDEYEEETEGRYICLVLERVQCMPAVGETEERCFVCSEKEKKQVLLHVGRFC